MLTQQDVRDAIASVNESFDAQGLPADADFGEAGLDSLDQASILLALQEKTGVEFPDGDLDRLNTIQAIVAYVEQRSA